MIPVNLSYSQFGILVRVSAALIKKTNSWQDFTDLLAPLNQKRRGTAFELLTELLLQIDPVYRSKLKHVWHESNLPTSIRSKLGLPYPEIGVDLVAQTYGGEYWAIQCKYHHDPSRNLTYGELKSFLDITSRVCAGKFSNLLAVSSAHGYSIQLQKHAPEVQYCLSDRFQGLDKDFFTQARRVLRKQTPTFTARTPRPHQQTAIQNAVDHFVDGGASRGKLIHPCGTGKSLIGYWIAEAFNAKTILVALPSLYLVRQTITDWTKESLAAGREMDWMVVCSEDTISDLSRGDPAMRFQEIGVDVTTDVDRIAKFLRRRITGQKVFFTTYQSGYVTAEAARKANRIFDVGIFDEAHRTVGQKDALFSHLIDDSNIQVRKRVFMTATERRYRGSSDTILSMDDVDAYGETFDLMTFREALEQKRPILSDYMIVTMVIGQSEVQRLIDQNFLVKPDKGRWNDDTEARTLAALIALRKVMRDYGANHALSFHNSIAKAEAFQQSQINFNRAIDGYEHVDSFHVSSKVSTGDRKAELDRFRDSPKAIITNAKCLTEGVDVPTIDAVLFADTKRSTVDIVQAAGRALRPAEGKDMGYIIVPVLVDEDDPESANEAFQDILMTLRALAANDDRIIDYFRCINRGQRPNKVDSIIEFVMSDPVRIQVEDFVSNIETQAWNRLAKLSWMPFEEARQFVHSLNLSNTSDWRAYARGALKHLNHKPRPEDLPSNPNVIYENRGWISLGDWLGTDTIASKNLIFKPYKEARKFVRSLGLKSNMEWRKYTNGEMSDLPTLPPDIPVHADRTYKGKGWKDWGDWLGTGTAARTKRKYQPFEAARRFARALKLRNQNEWFQYSKGMFPNLPPLPADIPVAVHSVYKNKGWQGYGDWLGTGNIANSQRSFLPFAQARRFVRNLGLENQADWNAYTKGQLEGLPTLPSTIPSDPARVYSDQGWTGFGDWLGTNRIATHKRKYRSFGEARDFVRKLKLKSVSEWRKYCKGLLPGMPPLPEDIPFHADRTYQNSGWISWPDWLGKIKE